MGFYAYIGRPQGSGEIAGDDIAEFLDQQVGWRKLGDQDPNRKDEWHSPWGLARLERDDPHEPFDGAYFCCRFSWATPSESMHKALDRLVALADQLGMIVRVDGHTEKVSKENLPDIVNKFCSASESVKELLGTTSMDDAARQAYAAKVLERDFESMDAVAYLICTHCGGIFEVDQKLKGRLEGICGEKIKKNNQYFKTEGCVICRQNDPVSDGMTIGEVPPS